LFCKRINMQESSKTWWNSRKSVL